jgi:hypothetical protein
MASVTDANTYFGTHLDKTAWEAAGDVMKAGAIGTAAMEINSLPLRKTITDELKDKAIYEQAIFRLKYGDKREDIQAQGVKSISISGGVSESFAQSVFGVPLAPRAKLFLMGWFQLGAII